MKRGKKPTSLNPMRTLSGNELRKRLRLLGPMIGAEFVLNPDAKTLSKKHKSGRAVINLVDVTWLQSQTGSIPDHTIAVISHSDKSECLTQASTGNCNFIQGDTIDELSLNLLSSLYSQTLHGTEASPTVLGWGHLSSRLAAKSHEAALQAMSAGLQSWGASRISIQRITDAMSKFLAELAATSAPIDMRIGSDGLLCEMSFEFHGTDLMRNPELCIQKLALIPSALISLERLAEGFRVRMISRANAIGNETAPGSVLVFNSLPANTLSAKLPKAS